MRLFSTGRPWSRLFCCVCLLVCSGLLGCGTVGSPLSTSISPLASEDLAGPCTFDLLFGPLGGAQRGVLVLYERGDTDKLYQDSTLRKTAQELGLSIIWAHECDAKSFSDFQADASKGPARMLFAALSRFADITGHPELNTVGIILYGFSAAGVLTSTMANVHPERLLGVIQYASGSAHLNLDDVTVSAAAAAVPRLVLTNANDAAAGTSRSYRYFLRGQTTQAPWAYAVQNGIGHCCTLSTRDVILPWIQTIMATRSTTAKVGASSGVLSYFVCTPDGVQDAQGETDSNFVSAGLDPRLNGARAGNTGWLPDLAAAQAWLTWVTNTP